MTKSLEDNVLFFFESKLSKKISRNYILNNPKFLSDEATFLMEDFFHKFNVTKGYLEIDKYFVVFPNINIGYFWKLITFKLPKEAQKFPIITISHMIEVAKKGEWFDP